MNPLSVEALRIWRAGVTAVDTGGLLRRTVRVEGEHLHIGPLVFPLPKIGRIAVVGAGKAAAPMAEALEDVLGSELLLSKNVVGWVNVPISQAKPLRAIYLHPARPMGMNEPTKLAAEGTAQILHIVSHLQPRDLCLCLLTGGASALMPAPIPPLSLEEKLQITRTLSAAGASIEQLNTVRKHLSRVKGGRLAAACTAGWLVTLVVSDVLGDRLDVIASGPTVPDPTTPADALRILHDLGLKPPDIPETVFRVLEARSAEPPPVCRSRVENLIIGNLATAVTAAAEEAKHLGYQVLTHVAETAEPSAEEVACQLVDELITLEHRPGPACLISGGEPVVRLVEASQRGRGGRNQQLVLAALDKLIRHPQFDQTFPRPFVLLSGGTDGEDGPTDAAGAWIDRAMVKAVARSGSNVTDFLQRNDAYSFFEEWGTLIKTGPTYTNVGDIRVILVSARDGSEAAGDE